MSFKQNYGQHQGSGTGSPQMSLNGQAFAAKNTAKFTQKLFNEDAQLADADEVIALTENIWQVKTKPI